jgi:N6-L-threonylcarbamoyladenine synthase
LPRAWLKDTDDFSFSGLKTAVLHLVEESIDHKDDSECDTDELDPNSKAEIAASFQRAVVDVLVTKTIATAERSGACNILLCGGVAANQALRKDIVDKSSLPVFIPSPILCTDNAAMIASCGYYHIKRGECSDLYLDVKPNAVIQQQ